MTRRVSLPGVDELFRSSKATSPDADTDSRNGDANLQIIKDTDALDDQPATADGGLSEAAPAAGETPDVVAVAVMPFPDTAAPSAPPSATPPAAAPAPAPPAASEPDEGRRPRHEEKVTFYCTGSDLTRIERARLALRAEHKLASDRGRIVRAALAEILDDFERRGADSALVARLRGRSEQ